MDCTKCGNPNVIIKKEQSGQYLCKDCFIESIEKKVIKTVRKEKLLDKGDKVLVALSGGKDSVTTLEILNSFRELNIIDICAVTVLFVLQSLSPSSLRPRVLQYARLPCPSLSLHSSLEFAQTQVH